MENICQSCGMPLTDSSVRGTESDGSLSLKYCSYCYGNGTFKQDLSIEEMTTIGLEYSDEYQKAKTQEEKEQIRTLAQNYLAGLKRWRQ